MTRARIAPAPAPGALILIALLLLPGCGNDGRRIGISETTQAELKSEKVLPVALIEFSDQAPRRLIEELASLPIINQTQGQATIILGDINNRTGIVPTTDFELAASRLRNNLINSRIAQDKMKFVERRARMERLAQREQVASGDYLADPEDYDPATTYALNGDFYRIERGDTNQYYMEFQLVHFGTNQIVFSDRFDVKQITGD